MLSVICPIYNEESRIEECILSILNQDYPKDDLEVLFVDGQSSDRTREIIAEYMQEYAFIQLLDNPKRIAPAALNIGIRASSGNIIIRLDAHAKYPENYFSLLVKRLEESGADNVGGVCRTLPAKETPVCRAIAHAMSSPFGMGNSYFRIGSDHEMWVDTVPFGCFRREIFDKIGLFDEELVRNQDDEFNGRIIKNGGKLAIKGTKSSASMANQLIRDRIQYGDGFDYQFYKLLFALQIKILKKLLIAGGLLSVFSRTIMWLLVSVIVLYVFCCFVFGRNRERVWPDILWMPFTFAAIHLSYGCGYWVGILKTISHRKISVQSNH